MPHGRAVSLSLCTLVSLLLAGCGAAPSTSHPTPVGDTHYSGSVHGGQQPVAGAAIQLYTVGTTADGSAATPLLTSTVASDANGTFTITGLYSCTNATQVYIVATGGNPGLSTTNPNIALMAALGPCSALTPSTFISINELTTVAAISALAPYMTSASAIGSSPSDAPALATAFTLANELVNTTTGTAPGTGVPSGFTVPIAELNTLADILSACINSTGGTAGDGSLCGQLFSLTTIAPHPAPTDTIAAMLNLVNNPTQNTSALFALTPPTPPFQPTLTSAPSTFQVQLTPPSSGPNLQLSPSSLNFTIVGALQDLTLSNQGSTAVNIASVTESDSGPVSAPAFTIVSNSCGASLPAQFSCTITVASSNPPTPTGTQPFTASGTLTVTDGAGTQTASLTAADVFQLQASGFPLPVPLSSGVITFPTTRVGSTQTAAAIYYTPWSSGPIAPSLPLTFSGFNTGDFSVSTNSPGPPTPATTCPDNYAYGEECQLTFSFKPTAAGQRSAKISLDPSFGTPTGQYILLQGTGTTSDAIFHTDIKTLALQSYLPSNIDPNSTGATTITVTNTGVTTLNLTAAVTGTVAPYIGVSAANCASVSPQATCQIPVTFSAPATGTFTGTLTLTDSSSGVSVPHSITATTAYWPAVATPGLVNFGSATVGSTSTAQNFVIADPNGYPLGHAYSLSLQSPSAFSLTQGSTCVASTTQTCTLAAVFNPQVAGPISEPASITDQTTGLQTRITLYGNGGAPVYTLSTTGIVFPAGIAGSTSAPIRVTLTSTGTQPVSISAISISGDSNNSFSQTNNCSSIAPHSTCTINVIFAPAVTGPQSATLQITGNGVNSPTSISLSGTASSSNGSPALHISPSTISFPATVTGFASSPQTITVSNTANGPVSITSTSITTATGATFLLGSDNSCIGTLSAGGSCTLSVTATPSSATGTGSLSIVSSTPDSPQSIPLSVTAAAAGNSTATLTPASFTFSIWGANKDFTVTNTGSAPLSVARVGSGTTGGGPQHTYMNPNNTCVAALAPGAACTFSISPFLSETLAAYASAPAATTGQIYVYDDALTGSGFQSVSVLDQEGSYLLQNGITSGAVTFPANQVGSTQTATVQFAKFTVGSPAASLAISGDNPGDFTVSAVEPSVSSGPSSSCPGTGTAACTITITFTPTAVGTRTAKISLDSASSSTGQYIYVTGTALPAGPSFTTNSTVGLHLFSYLPVGSSGGSTASQTFTAINTGTSTLNLGAAITGPNAPSFTADTTQCQSMAPQATCAIAVTFTGSVASSLNSYIASLFLYDQSSPASATVSLSGTTSNAGPAISLPLVIFPSQPVNTVSSPVTFTVNGFGDPLSVSVGNDGNFILPSGSSCPGGPQPCTLSVAFSPQSAGSVNRALTVTDTVTGASSSIVLSGTATQ